MALKRVIAKLDDVEEGYRSLYVKEGDIYKLQVEGDEDDVSKLKGALDKERKNAREAQKSLEELKRTFAGIEDPDQAREALNKLQQLKERKLIEEGDIEKVLATRTEKLKQEFEKERDALKKQSELFQRELHKLKVETAVHEAALQIGVPQKNAMKMISSAFENLFSIDEKGQVVAKDENGQTKYGKSGEPLTIAEHMQEFHQSHSYLFEPSKGSNAQGNNGNGKTGGISSEDLMKLPPSERLAKARELDSAKK